MYDLHVLWLASFDFLTAKGKNVVLAGNKLYRVIKQSRRLDVGYQLLKYNKKGKGKEPLECNEGKFFVPEATQHRYLCQFLLKSVQEWHACKS